MNAATTTAVLVNSLTTMVGFAALMVASHQGLWSLGRVLTIGMSCCLISALVLPNLLVLLPRSARGTAADDEEQPAAMVPIRVARAAKLRGPGASFHRHRAQEWTPGSGGLRVAAGRTNVGPPLIRYRSKGPLTPPFSKCPLTLRYYYDIISI